MIKAVSSEVPVPHRVRLRALRHNSDLGHLSFTCHPDTLANHVLPRFLILVDLAVSGESARCINFDVVAAPGYNNTRLWQRLSLQAITPECAICFPSLQSPLNLIINQSGRIERQAQHSK